MFHNILKIYCICLLQLLFILSHYYLHKYSLFCVIGLPEEELAQTQAAICDVQSSACSRFLIVSQIHRIKTYTECFLRLCPRQFGHPNHRVRSWRIVYHSRKKVWSSPYSLQELAEIILAPRNCRLALTAKAYLVASRSDLGSHNVREKDLTL